MSCQWTNLVGCVEICADEIYSPGLWELLTPENCGGSTLFVNTESVYYIESEYTKIGDNTVYIYSNKDLLGTVLEISSSVLNPKGGYINIMTLTGNGSGILFFNLSAYDPLLVPEFTFSVSKIGLNGNPIRSFAPIPCFVLGSSQCA